MKDQEKDPKEKDASAVTRRKFLRGIGAGAIIAPAGALAQEGTLAQIENVTVTPTRTDRFTPHLQPAAVRRSERRRPAGAARVWRAGRAARCEGSARGRAGPVDHEPGAQSQQPRQPGVHGRRDVSRPVPRPRHDVRRGVETRRADGARALDQHPDTVARSGFGVRRRTRCQSAALRSERPDQVQGRTRRRVRGSAAVGQ